jgi:hypothetical protein
MGLRLAFMGSRQLSIESERDKFIIYDHLERQLVPFGTTPPLKAQPPSRPVCRSGCAARRSPPLSALCPAACRLWAVRPTASCRRPLRLLREWVTESGRRESNPRSELGKLVFCL